MTEQSVEAVSASSAALLDDHELKGADGWISEGKYRRNASKDVKQRLKLCVTEVPCLQQHSMTAHFPQLHSSPLFRPSQSACLLALSLLFNAL